MQKNSKRKKLVWLAILPLLGVAVALVALKSHKIEVSNLSWRESGSECAVSFEALNTTEEPVSAELLIVASTYLRYVRGRAAIKNVGEKTLAAEFGPGEKKLLVETITIPSNVRIAKVEVFPDK